MMGVIFTKQNIALLRKMREITILRLHLEFPLATTCCTEMQGFSASIRRTFVSRTRSGSTKANSKHGKWETWTGRMKSNEIPRTAPLEESLPRCQGGTNSDHPSHPLETSERTTVRKCRETKGSTATSAASLDAKTRKQRKIHILLLKRSTNHSLF